MLAADAATKRAMGAVAKRWRALDDEIRHLDRHIRKLLNTVAPALLAV